MDKSRSKKGKPKKSKGKQLAKPGKLKPGKKHLSPGEPTERATVNLPASMYEDLVKRAAKRRVRVSAYLRGLVENDLRKAG